MFKYLNVSADWTIAKEKLLIESRLQCNDIYDNRCILK